MTMQKKQKLIGFISFVGLITGPLIQLINVLWPDELPKLEG